jgi:hypothetical protein
LKVISFAFLGLKNKAKKKQTEARGKISEPCMDSQASKCQSKLERNCDTANGSK